MTFKATKNGPELWKEILHFMPEGAIIAGGAVRDFYLGHEPKDIDVFINYDDSARAEKVICYDGIERYETPGYFYRAHTGTGTWFYDENPQSERELDKRRYEEGHVDTIQFIEDYIYKGKFKVNIIYLNKSEPLEHVYDFDLGTCRALYDGNLFYTQDFLEDMMNKTVTQLNNNSPENTKKRAERFIEKNKEFNFVEYKGPEDTPAVP